MHNIYELKEMLMKELEEYGSKGELTGGSLEVIDKLAHAIKNICKIIEAAELEDYSMAGGYNESGVQGMGSSYARGGGRGRGGNARRDGMGRYSNYGRQYSGAGRYSRGDEMGEMVESIREMMSDLPQDVQRDAKRFVQNLEQQMM